MRERPHPDVLLGREGREAAGDLVDRLLAIVRPLRTVTGWATVELDRAQREVVQRLGLGEPLVEEVPNDELLGASARLLRFTGDRDLILLEPATEGRLAASLARFDEGSAALYLVATVAAFDASRRAGLALSAERSGPLGPERLVVGTPRYGPHLLIVAAGEH